MVRRSLLTFVMLVVIHGVVFSTITSASTSFPDTNGHWAEEAIEFLYNKGIVNGLPNGTFGVDRSISRGDAAIMIARAKELDLSTATNKSPFKDVETDSYYFKEVVAATKAGYLSGYPEQTFNPHGNLTREEMAKILVDAYSLQNNSGAVFRDVKVKSWSFSAIQTLVSNKITNGFADKTFKPKKPISRAEFAMLLARTIDERFRDSEFEIDNSFPSLEAEAAYVITNYSPTGDYLLQSVANKDGKSVEALISKWRQEQNLFATINTSVHEEAHRFLHLMNDSEYDSQTGKWLIQDTYLLNNQQKEVVHYYDGEVFKSELMGTLIPENLRTARWSTYVAQDTKVGANVNGAYGLLNEFHAYYYGNKAAYDSYDYLSTLPYERTNWTNYYQALDGSSFYEFTFFILNYLLYAEEHDPEVYKQIINDDQFKKVFKYVYSNYNNYVEVLKPERETEIVRDLQKMGVHATVSQGLLWIGGNGHGNGNDVSALKQELSKTKYTTVLNKLLN